jgi:hypothetical protein
MRYAICCVVNFYNVVTRDRRIGSRWETLHLGGKLHSKQNLLLGYNSARPLICRGCISRLHGYVRTFVCMYFVRDKNLILSRQIAKCQLVLKVTAPWRIRHKEIKGSLLRYCEFWMWKGWTVQFSKLCCTYRNKQLCKRVLKPIIYFNFSRNTTAYCNPIVVVDYVCIGHKDWLQEWSFILGIT